ncbi:MAG: hypothetical protein AAF682_19515 [Planctomycetota bacterium]
MRVNVYAEEITDRVEIVEKDTEDGSFTGVRLYLYLPVTGEGGQQQRGPFLHGPGDDDSAAITFWGKRGLRAALVRALELLDEAHPEYAEAREG